ncbi:MAG: radical SAM protein [Bacteroidales bacterium]|nr:radical SAM protein [Bacteroidales bacterium]
MKYLLVTPPLTQLNTPYPATAALKGFLTQHGHSVCQADLGIELVNRIYTQEFLSGVFDAYAANRDNYKGRLAKGLDRIYAQRQQYLNCVERVVLFLQGKDNTLAPRIVNRSLLPEGPRFDNLADMEWAFGTSGSEDKARYLATLMMEDVADFVREVADDHFDLIRYAEQIANFAPTFDEFDAALRAPLSLVDEVMLSLLKGHMDQCHPDIVGLSIPFPGCLYGALRCGQWIKANYPSVHINLGGGFPNTEWRQLSEPRLFDFADSVSIDDGELPMLRLAEWLEGRVGEDQLVRTYLCREGRVCFSGNESAQVNENEKGTPDFSGLPLDQYISLAEMTNPMHRLWSNGRWNKLMMAHGCYWHKCAFCDTTLDYIGRYEAPRADVVVDRMERIMAQTGVSGFHFVDEALPPQLLREVSQEILRRGLAVTWWGNIRFEKAYTQELADLMADAGCVAVSGGLELASDRLLKLINKGVTIGQTVNACRHFKQAGIMVHTYLMYGFPTETLQETVNALEVVRSMFDEGIVQSAFWHRYAMTCHSESGQHAQDYGARRLQQQPYPFCNNEVDWAPLQSQEDSPQFDYDIEAVGDALRFATYNYMNEIGLEMPLKRWFSIKIPKPTQRIND